MTRYGDVTLLVGPGDEQVITRLLAAARAAGAEAGGHPDQTLSQTVAHLLATSEHVPSVCAIHELPGGVAALVHGDARVRIRTQLGTLELSSTGAATMDGFVGGKSTSVRAELGPAGEASSATTEASADGTSMTGTSGTEATGPVMGPGDPVVESSDPMVESSDPVAESSDPMVESSDPMAESSDRVAGTSDPVAEAGDPVSEASDSVAEASDPMTTAAHSPTCPAAHHHQHPSTDHPMASRPEPAAPEAPSSEPAGPPAAGAESSPESIVTSVEVEVELSPPLLRPESPASDGLTVTTRTTTGPDGQLRGVTATITGVRCRKGHFNDPELTYCGVCGIGLTQAGRILALDERPVLGVLLLDDGRLLPLDRDYVLGSAPDLAEEVARGEATGVRLEDGMVSDLHARVSLREWEVSVSDIGSTHGTYVCEPGGDSWEPLSAGGNRTLRPGALIAIGTRQLRFDTYRN
ncbi:MAG TPA: FHA domain-containing protein [Jatrophihabitans sp.]|uniref:FHA domain-containing protein n=1 Tax=Jatrophihabitans sp. TaxID=1932789 RepID=UPI002F1FF462